MSHERKCNKTLKKQSREMIYHIFNYMKSTTSGTQLQIAEKTAEATKTSVATVKRIIREARASDSIPVFRTPGKTRKKPSPITGGDNFDQGEIKKCILNFIVNNNEFPTINKLYTKLCADIKFKGSERSLRRVISGLGFQWRGTDKKKKVLIEKTNLRLQRINYLQKIDQYRRDKRPIVFAGLTTVQLISDNSIATSEKRSKKVAKSQSFIIIHAGSEKGFIPNALMVLKCGGRPGINQEVLTHETYEDWLQTQLIPNLPPKSVVVLGNAPYQIKQCESGYDANSKKSELQAWLREKGISFTDVMLKPQLHQLIKANTYGSKKFNVDRILSEYNHDVLRLPQHHSELSPIEYAWSAIKAQLSSKTETWDLQKVGEKVEEISDSLGPLEWRLYYLKVEQIEEDYTKGDRITDIMTDDITIQAAQDLDSSSSDDDEEEDDEEEVLIQKQTRSIHNPNVVASISPENAASTRPIKVDVKIERVTSPNSSVDIDSTVPSDDDDEMDTVELINEIMIRPELWMSKHPAFKNRWKSITKWKELRSSKFQEYSVDELKKRWKNIKDQYRKELKKLPQVSPGVLADDVTSGWRYFEYMAFLKDEIVFKDNGGEADGGDEPDPMDTITLPDYRLADIQINASPRSREPSFKSDDDELPIASNQRKNNLPPKEMREELIKIEQRKLSILEAELARNNQFTESDNYQFLMSILPEMEKLPSVQKMRLRTKISQAVLDEVTSYEQEKTHNIELSLASDSIEVKEEPINIFA